MRLGFAICLFVSVACGRSGLSAEDFDLGEPESTGGARGLSEAGAGFSGTGFSGTAGVATGGVATGGAGGRGGFGGAGPVGGAGTVAGGGPLGGAGRGGSAGSSGNGGMGGSSEVVDRGVVAVWAEDRWVVVTPATTSRALVIYEVSALAELLSGPRAVPIDEPFGAFTLVDAARSSTTGGIGLLSERAFISVSPDLEYAVVAGSLSASNCFVQRIEYAQDLFVFVSVRPTFEGPITVLETPGVINGNPGFYQKDLPVINVAGCRPLAFAPWVNPDGGVGVDFVYLGHTLDGMSLSASRLFDRNGLDVGTEVILPVPVVFDFNEPKRMDLVRYGTRSVASFHDAIENGSRYVLVESLGFAAADEIVQHAPLRRAAPMRGDEQGFLQAVVTDASPPQLQLRELWTGDVRYSARILALGKIVAVHLARGSEGAFAVAFRVAPPAPPNARVGIHLPGLYFVGMTRDEELFRTELPDL